MFKNKKIAIIPARKGSVRCPDKNNAIINGITIAERAIISSIKTNMFDEIIVSTNDDNIIEIASKYLEDNVKIDYRSKDLSKDKSTLIDVIRYIINKNNYSEDDIICLIPVTNPLRNENDIIEGLNLYNEIEVKNTIISVCDMEYPIELSWKYNEEKNILLSSFDNKTTQKQDFKPSYKWNDAFIIDSVKSFLDKNRNNFGYNPTPYFMPPERSLYIDYPWQLNLIRILIENKEKIII
jgi:CMP-N-acetylneuraminic acid synthetase